MHEVTWHVIYAITIPDRYSLSLPHSSYTEMSHGTCQCDRSAFNQTIFKKENLHCIIALVIEVIMAFMFKSYVYVTVFEWELKIK